MSDSLKEAFDLAHISDPAQQRLHATNVATIFSDMRLPPNEASKLH